MTARPVDRRSFLAAVGGGVLAAACGGSGDTGPTATTVTSPTPASPPNVLYITADDLGTRLSVYGRPWIHTPHVEEFATTALRFDECHCQSAICGPSRASILTGLRPETTGINANDHPWRDGAPGAVSLPRHFRDAGYRTRAIGKIEDPRNGELDDAWTTRIDGGVSGVGALDDFLDGVATDAAASPFFAAIGFDDPHCPWVADDESLERYPDDVVLADLGPGRTVGAGFLQSCVPGTFDDLEPDAQVELTEEQAISIGRGYLTEVSRIDSLLGHTLARAEELGLLENTIVIFWSGDHGFALGDSGLWGKWVPRASISRIPLLMRLPDGRGAGAATSALVEALDMYPTLVDLCGLEAPPQQLEGRSLVLHFDDQDRPGHDVVLTRHGRMSGISDGRWNLVHDDFWETNELYDRETDPHELTDVVDAEPEVVARLLAALDEFPTVLREQTFSDLLTEDPERAESLVEDSTGPENP